MSTDLPTSPSLAHKILNDGSLLGTFSGWGTQRVLALSTSPATKSFDVIADTSSSKTDITVVAPPKHDKKHIGLNVLNSVSIAGCDLLGSCLYTAGVCASSSGKLAPICLFLVTIMLFFFRLVYCEVVTAMPVNGGTYNLMLNTSSKKWAGFVACLSLLSYTATCIVSAFDAVIYLGLIWTDVDTRGFTVLIISLFTCITLLGVKESSTVTLFLFSVHTATITLLVVWGFQYGCANNFQIFNDNWESHLPNVYTSEGSLLSRSNGAASIFYGYSSALLGITGFETASNYVEDLASPATFVSSVNWMWLLAGAFNPLISLMSMMVLPMQTILDHPSDMLAVMARELGGRNFELWLCIDAVMVLCGGVLTAIVGVTGLLDRLAKDKVVPESLAAVSSWGSSYVAIICFSIGSISLFLCIYDPMDPTGIDRFGGVFAMSFLSVLAAFAFAAILLKLYRPNLARFVITHWWEVIFSFFAVLIGFIGNCVLNPDVFVWFLIYLSGLMVIVAYMFYRIELLSFAIWMIRKINLNAYLRKKDSDKQEKIVKAYFEQSVFDEFDYFLPDRVSQSKKSESAIPEEPRAVNKVPGFDADGANKGEVELTAVAIVELPYEQEIVYEDVPDEADIDRDANEVALPRRGRRNSFDETEFKKENPIRGLVLNYFMESLDKIVEEPFLYFAKRPDPASLHLAMEYISNNELSDTIYVVHFVDDRSIYPKIFDATGAYTVESKLEDVPESTRVSEDDIKYRELLLRNISALRFDDVEASNDSSFVRDNLFDSFEPFLPEDARRLAQYVSILDTFYQHKRISPIIIRGAFFCPAAVKAVVDHLKIRMNNVIMGVPDTTLLFPFAKISGCRLVVPEASAQVRRQVANHLSQVLKKANFK